MKPEVAGIIGGANLSGWKKVEVEYGARAFAVCVPRDCRIRSATAP